MSLPLLIFPNTVLRRAAALLPWFEPLLLLQPPSLEPDPDSPLGQAGLVRRVVPQGGAEAAGGAKGKELAKLLRQWEQWARAHQGSPDLAALKVGVAPPPPPETVRGLMKEIKEFGQSRPGRPAPPPEVTADLFLHLAHVRDRETADMEGILNKVDQGQQKLSEIMGLTQEDATPADYEQAFYDRLPPLDYSLDDQEHLERRLSAWATLAGGLGAEAADSWLATAYLPAVQLLLERNNQRLTSLGQDFRSPAGATMPGPGVIPPPPADSPLAQEAARLVLPDLSGLAEEALVEVRGRLMAEGDLAGLHSGLAGLLGRLAHEPWSAGLKEELGEAARALAEKVTALVQKAGVEAPGRGVSILAFPGLGRDEVLALMRGGDQLPALPAPERWPDDWPAGSCPLVVAW